MLLNGTDIVKFVQANCNLPWLTDNLLFVHVAGSRLYGINNDKSDYDIRGVALSPRDYWIGARRFEQWQCKDEQLQMDIVIYDIRKWLTLTVAANPNVVETLYVDPYGQSSLVRTNEWERIVERTLPLINKRAYVGFLGYLKSQFKKMVVKQSNKTGRQYISEEFGFDLKSASHGFRLASQGAELFRTGKITFPRPDKEFLRDVRFGKVYKGVQDLPKCISDLKDAQNELQKAYKESTLPEKADFDMYNQLLIDIYEQMVVPKCLNG